MNNAGLFAIQGDPKRGQYALAFARPLGDHPIISVSRQVIPPPSHFPVEGGQSSRLLDNGDTTPLYAKKPQKNGGPFGIRFNCLCIICLPSGSAKKPKWTKSSHVGAQWVCRHVRGNKPDHNTLSSWLPFSRFPWCDARGPTGEHSPPHQTFTFGVRCAFQPTTKRESQPMGLMFWGAPDPLKVEMAGFSVSRSDDN